MSGAPPGRGSPFPMAAGWSDPAAVTAMMTVVDSIRQLQCAALGAFGLGSAECSFRILASGPFWRLREYHGAGSGPALLVVAAPIKRPYIWDLAPSVSVLRHCLGHGLRVYLLEWMPASPRTAAAGLAAYAGEAIGEAVAEVAKRSAGARPFLIGHSLGGTFAALHTALAGDGVRGLVVLGAPLCFTPGSSRFRDAIVALIPPAIADVDVVPGSLLSMICSAASPDVFVWSRVFDAGLSLGTPQTAAVHARVERWALDELPLPGALLRDIFAQLYQGNRFCKGTLELDGKRLSPQAVEVPTLAVVNTDDEIAPPESVEPFLETLPPGRARTIRHGGEHGVGLQHLAVLVGQNAHARVWPEIIAWLDAQP